MAYFPALLRPDRAPPWPSTNRHNRYETAQGPDNASRDTSEPREKLGLRRHMGGVVFFEPFRPTAERRYPMSTMLVAPQSPPRQPLRRRSRQRWFRALALLLTAALGAAALETAARVLSLGSDLFHEPDAWVGHRLIPGAGGVFNSPADGGARRVTISSQGLRDREYTLAKPTGTRRILILGDSYCEGLQVEEDETFQAVLERRLALAAEAPPVEVINSGVSGYGTDNELLYYRHVGRGFQPDLVVLSFFTNDLEDNSVELQRRFGEVEPQPYFTLSGEELTLHDHPYRQRLGAVDQFLKQHLRSYRAVWQRWHSRTRAARVERANAGLPGQFTVHLADYDADHEAAWRLLERLVLQVRDEMQADGVRFAVQLCTCSWQVHPEHLAWFQEHYPAMADRDWDWPMPNRRLAEFCAAHGIACLDLLPAFTAHAQATGEELHFRGGHWNAAGHQLAAHELRAFLEQRFPDWRTTDSRP